MFGKNTFLRAMYFSLGNDFYMDYINSLCDAFGKDVYDIGVIYPPLANMLYHFTGKLVINDVLTVPFAGRGELWKQPDIMLSYLLYTVVTASCFCMLIRSFWKKQDQGIRSGIISILLLLSYPVTFAMERGNIILIASVLTIAFFIGKDSSSKVTRELSYIALALAAAIKIYPALFGLMLLLDKKYKEAARTAIYGAVLFFVPFFFYDGFESLVQMLKSIYRFSTTPSAAPSIHVDVSSVIQFTRFASPVFQKVAMIISLAMVVFSLLVLKEKWKKTTAICLLFINIPACALAYGLSFLIAPVMFLLTQEKPRKIDYLYLLGFVIVLFGAYPTFFMNTDSHIALASYVMAIPLHAISFALFCEAVLLLIRKLSKKQKKVTA